MNNLRCPRKKCGEYNMLRCCNLLGHTGEHNYVVDYANDYEHNKPKQLAKKVTPQKPS